MDLQKLETLPPPPGVIESLKTGFDVASNRLMLMLIPLALDLLLWFGPRLSVNKILGPYYMFIFDNALKNAGPAEVDQLIESQKLFSEFIQNFNLLSFLSKLRFFPVGINSLSTQTLPVENPIGSQFVLDISSVWLMFGLILIFIPMGWITGGIYFRQVAGSILYENELKVGLLSAVVQTIFLSILWTIGFFILIIPVVVVLALIAQISLAAANIVFLILAMISFWLVVPLFFTPHGIFIRRQNALFSIYNSMRMTRFSLPTSSIFVLSYFLLLHGLDILWQVPDSKSWLTLVGFAGHAFISTALLTSSFVYYRDMTNWLQFVYEKLQQAGKKPLSTS